MKLLIIGGTVFLGRHLVEGALRRGHEVTTFTRGQHNPEAYPEVEKLRGDRDGDLGALEGRRWDAAIDTSGYFPRVVAQSAKLLADAVDRYTFISTLSVYPDLTIVGLDEESAVGTIEDETVEEITGETYGPLKALCEKAVERELPDRTLVIRPGLIVGRYDPSDRFTYWPVRVARGGEVLTPGRPDRAVQFIDAHDLAEWTLDMVERRATGLFNADGPDRVLTMREVLDTCRSVSGSDARFTWVPDTFLIDQGVGPWMEMTLWVPEEGHAGFFTFDNSKAIAAGLRFRPLPETVRDTLDWARTRPEAYEWRAGLKPERELELLRDFHQRQPTARESSNGESGRA